MRFRVESIGRPKGAASALRGEGDAQEKVVFSGGVVDVTLKAIEGTQGITLSVTAEEATKDGLFVGQEGTLDFVPDVADAELTPPVGDPETPEDESRTLNI